MVEEPARAAMRAYYERGEERDRLAEPRGQLEFERTKEIVLRHLPPPPAVVADIGGGPGRYALWLAELGYQVVHRDLMPTHVEQLRQASGGNPLIDAAVADARELDLADASADAVLLLGPLYHLGRRADRLRALAEAWRVVRPGGPVFVAAISRWAPGWTGSSGPASTRDREMWRVSCLESNGPGTCLRSALTASAATRTGQVSCAPS
jgi:SAM-dependent methyltransferase